MIIETIESRLTIGNKHCSQEGALYSNALQHSSAPVAKKGQEKQHVCYYLINIFLLLPKEQL